MRLGNLEVTKYALGTWAIGGGPWWGNNDDLESIRTIQKAVEEGISLIDTAPAYGFGHSEEMVGKALAGMRDKVYISTKCGLVWDERGGSEFFRMEGKTVCRNLSKESIQKEAEDSLKRLNTDHIDVYITHWQSVEPSFTPIEETMGALLQLKEQGKILAIGASNIEPAQLEEYLKYGPVDLVQEKFSILDRKKHNELRGICEKNKVVFQAYSPMELGLLTGRIADDYVPPQGAARDGKHWFRPENIAKVNAMLRGWKPLEEKYNVNLAPLAVAWVAAQADYVNVLCGARTMPQLIDNLHAVGLELESADVQEMTRKADEVIVSAV